ncbi:signal peptidase I [Deinococcus yavapaiensis]|uniref:Signal peptidase I n=1 Tax=Deinococcus yavapaiensis KR-236 TaxID=694435 RepID=A0A318S8D5_9DEIO|nr:signal peptidase I [Deinococcus yavapaiensis]PYE55316.1 signal peptidase I [Deinococcus yavapaiensis KR-236]
MTKPKPVLTPWQRLWRELLEPILFAVVITQFLVTLVGVDGASMMPNLRNGERVVVPKYETWLHRLGVGQFSRGDILIFKPPGAAESRSFLGVWDYRPYLIKRLIGLPGDRVRIESGNVYVNDKLLDQGFTTNFWKAQGCWDTTSELANNIQYAGGRGVNETQQTFTVPAGQYFLMGDNRTASGSEDSRLFGPIPMRDIAGRAALVVWPIQRKANAKYDCNQQGGSPDQIITFDGPSQLNWRMLGRPSGFQAVTP